MNCKNCGSVINGTDQFCQVCGTPVNKVDTSNMTNQNMVNNQQVNQGITGVNTVNDIPMNNENVNGMMNVNNSMNQQSNINSNINSLSNQVPMNNGNKSNNSNKLVIIVIIVVSLILVVIAFFAGAILLNTSANISEDGSDESTSPTAINNGYKVDFSGVTLTVPEDVSYADLNNILVFEDNSSTWAASLEVAVANLSDIKGQLPIIASNIEQSGYTVSDYFIEEISGEEYVVFNVSASGVNYILLYNQLTDTIFAGSFFASVDNTFDLDNADDYLAILNTATTKASSHSIENSLPTISSSVLNGLN